MDNEDLLYILECMVLYIACVFGVLVLCSLFFG